jgi:hypothetical protein
VPDTPAWQPFLKAGALKTATALGRKEFFAPLRPRGSLKKKIMIRIFSKLLRIPANALIKEYKLH